MSDDDVAEASAGRWSRFWALVGFPVKVFAAVALVLYTVSWASITFLSRHVDYPIHEPVSFRGGRFLEGWFRFDGGWYKLIVDSGYQFTDVHTQSSVAFFPAYPMAMSVVRYVTGDVILAGIVTTFVCGLGVAVLFYRWCTARLSPESARLAIVLFLVYPYCWYLFGAVYADALFLLCAIGAFVLVEHDHPVWAGLVAAVATAARPVGGAVVVGLLAVLLEHRGAVVIPVVDKVRAHGWRRRRWPTSESTLTPTPTSDDDGAPRAAEGRSILGVRFALRRLRPADAGVLLSLGGLGAWSFYLWRTFGSPFLFAEIENAPGWDQGQGPRTWFKITWLQHLHHLPEYVGDHVAHWNDLTETLGMTLQGLLCIAFILCIPLLIRRIGWGYTVYVLALLFFPVVGTKDWQGTGRYLLAAFPVFAAVADWMSGGARIVLRRATIAVSAVLLLIGTSMFARGYYVA